MVPGAMNRIPFAGTYSIWTTNSKPVCSHPLADPFLPDMQMQIFAKDAASNILHWPRCLVICHTCCIMLLNYKLPTLLKTFEQKICVDDVASRETLNTAPMTSSVTWCVHASNDSFVQSTSTSRSSSVRTGSIKTHTPNATLYDPIFKCHVRNCCLSLTAQTFYLCNHQYLENLFVMNNH